jgi:hypothetical protein
MTGASWQDEWRAPEPREDFARRVVLELEREERLGAQAVGRRRAAGVRRVSPLGILGIAALLLSGAAAASLGSRRAAVLDGSAQESAPTEKPASASPRLQLLTPPAPMVPERAVPEPAVPEPAAKPARRVVPPLEVQPAPPGPIHYPPCHCSSGAVVCSCVD